MGSTMLFDVRIEIMAVALRLSNTMSAYLLLCITTYRHL